MNQNKELQINETRNEVIKNENKKAMGKFIGVMLICAVIGFFAGLASGVFGDNFSGISESFKLYISENIKEISIVFLVVMCAVIITVTLFSLNNINQGKKRVNGLMESDNMEALEKLENKLSFNLWLTSFMIVLTYFFFSAMVFMDKKYVPQGDVGLVLVSVLVFIVGIFAAIKLQQKIVDLTKLINPEKKGSVYDMNFHKKWEENSDEAELFITYKAAYKAYRTVNTVCIILWVVFTILGMATGVGFLPIVVILIIWATMLSVSSYYSIKYSK